MRVLITTTVNVPENLRAWSATLDKDDQIIVAGDKKTPHMKVVNLLNELVVKTTYLHPDVDSWRSSKVIGYNSVQRRNLALLEAIRLKPSFITTIDDDNWPINSLFYSEMNKSFHFGSRKRESKMCTSTSGFWNAGRMLATTVEGRNVRVRGLPPVEDNVLRYDDHESQEIGVVASLWHGDPDVGAVNRMCCNPLIGQMNVDFNVIPGDGTWCPFNSQATTFLAQLAPLMMVWPGVGRYDDIWASYLAQKIMHQFGFYVSFGRPLVNQDRNKHDPLQDLQEEMFGMLHTNDLCMILRSIDLGGCDTILEALQKCYRVLKEIEWMPNQTSCMFDAWFEDLRCRWSMT